MTHPEKDHRQFAIRRKDVATVGRLGGGYPVPAIDWMQALYGIGFTGVGRYYGTNIDHTSNQGTDSDDADSTTTEATGDAAGGTAGSM